MEDGVGLAFFGQDLLLLPAITDTENCSSLYYIDEEDTYAITNCGSYDMYPDITVSSGTNGNITIKKEGISIYDYDLNFNQTMLTFNGKVGMATYNGVIAEGAVVVVGLSSTNLVKNSVNNGILNIENSNPELKKIKIISNEACSITQDENDLTSITDASYGMNAITFLMNNDFSYSHDGRKIIHLFSGVSKELPYNTGSYPIINSESISNTSEYGSKVNDSIISINALLFRTGTKNKNEYTLLIPNKEIKDNEFFNTINEDNNKQAYLSIADYTEISITDADQKGYISLQTRDAY